VIGRVLDKYKILEEVGQGGMSVVYKGMDTSLNREVAVKVLHPHLASQDEARQRFQREAHAVAKLRHENILEIFDYSGRESPDSYIVTEFIKGRTLRGFIGERALAFPELAAMIAVEVCRALAHAHSLGVLHRDVKPENIMVRDDGVLKLMDFGIAQIVDSQRMTVTGQLLGSPAYMSPEHVEGRPLDFRTDVFSAGILLYQLSTGELPFKGRNPHEILKRIAECRYLDARVVNPLVSDRLNRIITHALARDPDDRYPDVAPLLDDLGRFLGEVELGEPRAELRSYFANPAQYGQALRQRLIIALTQRGRAELESKHTTHALELWNRVLTIDPSNEAVLGLIDRLSKRRRITWGVLLGIALLVASAAVALVGKIMHDRPAAPPVMAAEPSPEPSPAISPALVSNSGLPDAIAAIDVTPPAVTGPPPRPIATGRAVAKPVHHEPPPPPAQRVFRVVPSPKNASVSIDDGPFSQVDDGALDVKVGPGPHKITFRNPLCLDHVERIDANDPSGRTIVGQLTFKPTQVRVHCPQAEAISIDGRSVVSGAAVDIRDFRGSSKKLLAVDFLLGDQMQHKKVTVTAGEPPTEVSCDGP